MRNIPKKQMKFRARDKLLKLMKIPGERRTNVQRIQIAILDFRVKNGLTQDEAAAILGYCTPVLSKYESGKENRAAKMPLERLEELASKVGKTLYIEFRDKKDGGAL